MLVTSYIQRSHTTTTASGHAFRNVQSSCQKLQISARCSPPARKC